ncbi:MAG: XrtA-associated tyrosine autokinase [Burkholderiaceae bacterium]
MADKRPPSIIEQAAKRLAELQRAGIAVPNPAEPAHIAAELAIAPTVAPNPTPAHEVLPAPRVQIDLDRLQGMGYLAPGAPRTQLADEFRVIKRPLLNNIVGKSAAGVARPNLIMITSALPGEGKTFSAINLALSIASEMDRTVLLVDADVQRPAILDRLGLPRAKGLLDLLTDASVGVQDVLLRTNIEKLSILPAGSSQSHATELIASEAMTRLVDELAGRYADRVLIFDAPPLLPSTESRVLATHMGQVVMVVAADRTPQASAAAALATIESCPIVMTLLNKAKHSGAGSYYGYYGGYGYGYGS